MLVINSYRTWGINFLIHNCYLFYSTFFHRFCSGNCMCLVIGYEVTDRFVSKHNITNGVDGIQSNVNLKEEMYGTKCINLAGIWSNL